MQEQVLSQNANEGKKPIEDDNEYLQKIKENSEKAEYLFGEYLNKIEIPFFRVDQKINSKCDVFFKKDIKRPDYIIQTKNDYFYIDVKQRSTTKYDKSNEKRFTLDRKNILGLFYFQEEFHQKVWLAYIDDLEKTNFYFVSISKVYEYYNNIINTIVGDNYFDRFTEIYDDFFSKGTENSLLIYIPERLFYNQLSFDKGFYKDSDKDFYKDEVEYHKSIWEKDITKMIDNIYWELQKYYKN